MFPQPIDFRDESEALYELLAPLDERERKILKLRRRSVRRTADGSYGLSRSYAKRAGR